MMNQIEPLKRVLVRVDDAASMLGVGRATAYRMIKRGELKVVRIGGNKLGRIRVPVAEVERLGEEAHSDDEAA